MSIYDKEKSDDSQLDPKEINSKGPFNSEDLAEKEASSFDDSSANSPNQTESAEELSLDSKLGEQSFYRGYSDTTKTGNSLRSRISRKKLAIGSGIVSLILAAVFGVLTYIPLQVAHIKEVFRGAYGGTQEATLTKRKMRIYNRAFFFRDDGEFDGYKEKGVFGFIKNRSSTKLINDLESKGFKVTPDLTPDGKWTGRFTDLEYKGQKITSSNSSIWERRSAVRNVLSEEYPTRGFIWRSTQARKVYSRYGLNRTNWWSDNALTRKISDIDIRFRSKVRSALLGSSSGDLSVKAPTSEKNADGSSKNPDLDAANEQAAGQIKSELDSKIKESIDADVTKTDPPNPIKELDNAAVGAATGSVLSAIKVTGTIESACTGLKTLNQIESGSRTIKRLQLIKSFSVYMSLVDAVRTGTVDSKDIGAFMKLMTTKDPETGKNAYQSGGWLWASKGSGKQPRYGNTFNTGGGTTGVMRNFRTTAYSFIPGGATGVEGTCKTVSNGLFQIGSAVLGIGLAIFSGGTFTAGNFVASFFIQTAVSFLNSFATPILTNLAAGTIVNGWEKGEKFGDMLSAASGSAYYVQGSQTGQKPLNKQERVALMNEYNDMLDDEFSQKPFYAKLFDLSSPRSVLSVAVINFPKSAPEFATVLSAPLRLMRGTAVASDSDAECNDPEIIKNNLATDPFCNPILGEPQVDSVDPIENIKWMLDNKQIDDDGNPYPSSDYSNYVAKCFENRNIETLFQAREFTTVYDDTCVAQGANNKYLRFRAYRIDNGLTSCMAQEIDKGHCDSVEK